MSRIKDISETAKRQGSKLLIPYLVAGDPNIAVTLQLMHQLVASGADLIELGVPFSDPSSDGPVIQRGIERSLAQGTTLKDTIEIVRSFREKNSTTPVVLMGYLNPIEIMGYELFAESAAGAGVDGVLIVDMPPAESQALRQALQKAEIDTIYLVAPTTKATRAKSITEVSSGYLYYVSLKGVTGAALIDSDSVRENIVSLRKLCDLPIVIGFGIKDGCSAKAMAMQSDGVVIGSALVEKIATLSTGSVLTENELSVTTAIIKEVREAIDTLS
ncbi:MAG: tryptophan synthase subunit alpha [Gammaproteobacteria bacterium]|jgi:tryptophan synthase alpha chain|nr:tryptophan synthase subunit alpha [Gammaproteobacteria bacterium]